jgi:hypothetical protein
MLRLPVKRSQSRTTISPSKGGDLTHAVGVVGGTVLAPTVVFVQKLALFTKHEHAEEMNMWTYTATVVEVRREPNEEVPACTLYIIDKFEDEIFSHHLLDEIVGKSPDWKLKSGFYYIEWGYGNGQPPVVYQLHRIGDLAPQLPPMDSMDNMALNSGGMF